MSNILKLNKDTERNKNSNNLGLMYDVASLYYLDKVTQESIARKFGISKYKVNRMLKKALAQGIVEIKIVRKRK